MNVYYTFQHSLLDSEAENVRTSITNAVQQIKSFGEEVADSARKLGVTIHQVEGGLQVLQSPEGATSTQRVCNFVRFFYAYNFSRKVLWNTVVCLSVL